jgi:hypothetical protein
MKNITLENFILVTFFILGCHNAKGVDTADQAKIKITNWIDNKTAYECEISDGSGIFIKDFYYKESGIPHLIQKADALIASKMFTCYKFGFNPNQHLIFPVTKLKLLVTDNTLRGAANKTIGFSPGDKVSIQNLLNRGQNFSTGQANSKSWMAFSVPQEVTKVSPVQGNYDPSKTSNVNSQLLLDGTSLTFKFTYDSDGQVNILEITSGSINKTFQVTYNSFDLATVKLRSPSMPNGLTLSEISVAQATVAEIRLSPSSAQ